MAGWLSYDPEPMPHNPTLSKMLKKQCLVSALQINKRQRTRRCRSVPVVFAAQSNFLKVLWNSGD
ncbi:uncharacterized protein Pyn_37075 [Prunus yedoensis var. nudiflora]|uniref:Uncharacterized protein n=1 Tax=Prunus yedoensis var. nudiflora TaxID=2094558 RepID=A0A314YIX0_PRUYE|nr:uncharacterized protein Pyn_37075 [Prunus yedoensis var. nudiflora]